MELWTPDKKNEAAQRQAVVAEARSWCGTPYHHRSKVKGSGVDCGQVILETFFNTGLVKRFPVDVYNHDWHMHRNEEKYLSYIEDHMTMTYDFGKQCKEHWEQFADLPQPGDVMVWRWGRTFSHGAVVTDFPNFVHAYFPSKTTLEENLIGHPLMDKYCRVYSYWKKPR